MRRKLNQRMLDDLIDRALDEDVGPGDVTTAALVGPALAGIGRLVARESGVLAGMPVVERLLRRFDPRLRLVTARSDGARVRPGSVIAVVRGPVAPMLTIERTLLNFLQQLSGVATLTRRYADAIGETGARLLDTRKTLPGWRTLAKYAVAVGGGTNHRMGLYDQVLIKDNHLAVLGVTAAEAVGRARRRAPRGLRVEVEVESTRAACAAAAAGADIIMLDNMTTREMRRAVRGVRLVRPRCVIEASGRITLKNIRAVARTGVDWISVGSITHSAPALDIAFEVERD